MKANSLLMIALLVLASANVSSAFSPVDNIPHDGDKLHPGLTKSAVITSRNDSARCLIINPSMLSYDNDTDAAVYVDGDTVSYVQFATKHRFLFRNDTLLYIGFENRASDFRLYRPAKVAVFPLKDSESICDIWTGHLFNYGSMLLKKIKGESNSTVQSGWTITDGTDSIHNAIRLSWTLDMAYADADSIDAEAPDSVTMKTISDMQIDIKAILSERLLTSRELWFAPEARYPVLTDSRASRIIFKGEEEKADTVTRSHIAMYYPATDQYSDTGDEAIRLAMENKNKSSYSTYSDSNPAGGSETETYGNLTISEPDITDNHIQVTLSSSKGNEEATLTLYSDTGIRLSEPQTVRLSTVPQTFSLGRPSGWTGVTLLRIETDISTYTRKILN